MKINQIVESLCVGFQHCLAVEGKPWYKSEAEETVNAPGGSDVRKERIDQIYSLLRGYAAAHKGELKMMNIDPDDFIQDVVMNIFRRKGLDKYDPSKGMSFETLIFRIAKNYLIDKSRAQLAKSRTDVHGKPIQLVSLDAPLQGRSGETLADVLGGRETEREGEEYSTPEYESIKGTTPFEKLGSVLGEMDDQVEGVPLADLATAVAKEAMRVADMMVGRPADPEMAKTLTSLLSKLVSIVPEVPPEVVPPLAQAVQSEPVALVPSEPAPDAAPIMSGEALNSVMEVLKDAEREYRQKTGYEGFQDRQLQDLLKFHSLYPNAPNGHWFKDAAVRIKAELENRGYSEEELKDWMLQEPTLPKRSPDVTYA